MSAVSILHRVERAPPHDFGAALRAHRLALRPLAVETLQLNITRMCNQACRHCHVDASPARTEAMAPDVVERCLEVLAHHPEIGTLDLTGGAPELHPLFDSLVERASALGKRVIVRHNLTVQADGHPHTGESKAYLPAFFAKHRVEVVSSLPYWQPYFTDAQRGAGAFAKSIEALRRLNAVGYGAGASGLALHLVYNPVGPYLPPPQPALEADYRRELAARHGIVFNRLYTITNMPIHRFRLHLEKTGQYEAYLEKLRTAFNPAAAEGVMCRTLLSIGPDGRIYDCDFNQMAGLHALGPGGRPLDIRDFDLGEALARRIRFDAHCFGCTAGSGSSCNGATVQG